MFLRKAALTLWVGAISFGSSICAAQAPVVDRTFAQNSPDQTAVEILLELQALRQEVSQLRGTVEELEYKLGRLAKDQKRDYQNLDQRLLDVGNRAVPISTSPVSTVSPPGEYAANTDAPGVAAANTVAQETQVSAQQMYTEGFAALRTGDRNTAIQVFGQLVETYPQASRAADARYWLGETYWLDNQAEKSRQSFVQLLADFPQYRKAGDAKYRLGIIYDQLGDTDTAFDYMSDVLLSGSNQAVAAQSWINDQAKNSVSNVESTEVEADGIDATNAETESIGSGDVPPDPQPSSPVQDVSASQE